MRIGQKIAEGKHSSLLPSLQQNLLKTDDLIITSSLGKISWSVCLWPTGSDPKSMGTLLALLAKMILGKKKPSGTNTLAYFPSTTKMKETGTLIF